MIFVMLLLLTILLAVTIYVILFTFIMAILQFIEGEWCWWRRSGNITGWLVLAFCTFWISFCKFWFTFWDFNISMRPAYRLFIFSRKAFIFLFSMCCLLVRKSCRPSDKESILSRVVLRVHIFENLLKSASLLSHPRLGNLNETRNALSPGFFLKILNSLFESINMGLDHKLFLQLLVIGFCLFCSRIGKR